MNNRFWIYFAILTMIAVAGGVLFFHNKDDLSAPSVISETLPGEPKTLDPDSVLSNQDLSGEREPEQSTMSQEIMPGDIESIAIEGSKPEVLELLDRFRDWRPFISVRPLFQEPLSGKPVSSFPDFIPESDPVQEAVLPPVLALESESKSRKGSSKTPGESKFSPHQLPEGTRALSPVPESSGALTRLPEGTRALSPVPESSETLTRLPEGTRALPPVPESSGALTRLPEGTQALPPVPESSETLTRLPEGTRTLPPVPESSETLTRLPEGTRALPPVPESSETLTRLPEGTRALPPVPESSETLTRLPEGTRALSPVPESSGALTRLPEGTRALPPVPESSETLTRLPEGTRALPPVPESSETLTRLPEGTRTLPPVPESSETLTRLPEGTRTLPPVAESSGALTRLPEGTRTLPPVAESSGALTRPPTPLGTTESGESLVPVNKEIPALTETPEGDKTEALETEGITSSPVPEKGLPPISRTAKLSIDFPLNGNKYHSLVNVTGRGSPGAVLSWEAPALNAEGSTVIDENGVFSFVFSTLKFRGDLLITVRDGEKESSGNEVGIRLVNDDEGPSLSVKEPSEGSFYQYFLPVIGTVGPGSTDPEGVGEIESLEWQLVNTPKSPRPVFFNTDGSYEFRIDMRDVSGDQKLVLIAKDLNGNETLRSYNLVDGRLLPEIVLSGPESSGHYGAAIRFWGSTKDPYDAYRIPGMKSSLSYEILAANAKTRDGLVSGEIPVSEDGSFDFSLFSDTLSGKQNVALTFTSRNGRSRTVTITLEQGLSAIPGFSVNSMDKKIIASWDALPLTDKYEITVSGRNNLTRRYSVKKGPVVIPQLTNGELYTLRLEAVTARGRFFSTMESVIPISRSTLQPTVVGEYRRIKISWPMISGTQRYALFRSESASGPFELLEGNIEKPPFLDTRTMFGKNYWYAVAPENFKNQLSYPVRGTTLAVQKNRLEQVAYLRTSGAGNLKIIGDYAYGVAEDTGLIVYDVAESTKPHIVGKVPFKGATDIEVKGNYAFVATGWGGLKVLNIDDPIYPLLVGSRLAGNARGIDVSGSYAFIADGERGLRVLDVTTPSKPSRLSFTEGYSGYDIAVKGNYAFLAVGDDGLLSVDISNPAFPKVVANLKTGSFKALTLRKNLLIASGRTGGLTLFDVSDPVAPIFISRLSKINAGEIHLSGDFILVIGDRNLYVVDIRIPEKPFLFDTIAMKEQPLSLATHGDDLLVSSKTGLEVYKTFLTGHSYVIGGRDLPGRSYRLEKDGKEFLISSHRAGLVVIDAVTLETIEVIDSDFASDTAVAGPWLFLADGPYGLRVYRRDSLSEGPVVSYENLGLVNNIAVTEKAIYVSSIKKGLFVLETGPPDATEPLTAGSVPLEGCIAVTTFKGFVFASNGRELVSFVEIPGALPREIGRITLSGIESLDAKRSRLVASGAEGAVLYGIDGSGHLEMLSTLDKGAVFSAEVDGNDLYVSSGYQGFSIFDISRPLQPILLTTCPDVFAFSSIVEGETAWVVDGNGIRKIQIFIPEWLR